MKIAGIICEYNPLHNGHLYHLNQVRARGYDAVVAVMSGDFVQRGDIAILDKFTRARLAVQAGVDLVIELPVAYATAPAEIFALGGISILDGLGCVSDVIFGSECGDTRLLIETAAGCRRAGQECHDIIEKLLRSGCSYPDVISQVVSELCGDAAGTVLREPNNTLGIAYINAIESLRSPMKPIAIQRRGAHHNNNNTNGHTASGSSIRRNFFDGGDCRRSMPSYAWHALSAAQSAGRVGQLKYLERPILYKLRTTSPEHIQNIAEMGQGLENRFYKARTANSLGEVMQIVATKRYPTARLRRILLHLLLDIKNNDMQSLPPYGRILACNETGSAVLREAKHTGKIPYLQSLADLEKYSEDAAHCAALEAKATDIFMLGIGKIGAAETDYRHKAGIIKGRGE